MFEETTYQKTYKSITKNEIKRMRSFLMVAINHIAQTQENLLICTLLNYKQGGITIPPADISIKIIEHCQFRRTKNNGNEDSTCHKTTKKRKITNL